MEAFRRYTNLADLIYILRERRITLRDPQRWDDKNDSYYLEKYKEYKNLKTLLALCFADKVGETYHHWQVFSSGADGVSIEFDKDKIRNAFREQCKRDGGVKPFDRRVKYAKMHELESNPPCVDDLPFLKWFPYGDEHEYRIVYANENFRESWGFEIDLDWIGHISLSPWLPAILKDSVSEHLRSIHGCSGLCISRSQVIDFDRWKAVADRIEGKAPRVPSTKAGSFDPIQLAGVWPGDEPLEELLAQLD